MYTGPERRQNSFMNQEDHDLLIKISSKQDQIETKIDGFRKDQLAHEVWDNKRFMYMAVALLITASASGILPQLLNHVKLGGM